MTRAGRDCAWLLTLALGTFAGCGGGGSSASTAHLQGTVTLNGQPLPAGAEGSVSFRPSTPGVARGVTVQIIDGKYDSPETPKGGVTAYFSIYKPTGRSSVSERTGEAVAETVNIVPAKVASGVDFEVTGDDDARDFDLTE